MTDRTELITRVADLAHRMGRAMRAELAEQLADVDLTMPMGIAIHHLEQPVAMRTLAHSMQCDASYITGLADQLEDRGLVERVADPTDRRVRHLALTAEGTAVAALVATRFGAGNPFLDRLTNAELKTFAGLLEKALGES